MTDPNGKNDDILGAQLKTAFQDTVDEGLPAHFRQMIDDNLKKGVSETLEEGIPERFIQLLEELKAATQGSQS